MPPNATIAKCTEHVLSIQPTHEELKSFEAFDIELLLLEGWPPLVVNYIHRWMHRHSLYSICPSRTRSLSDITDTLVLLTKLPKTDDIKEKVTRNCASLVTQSALKWENEGLLIQRGFGLSKRAMLRDVWATYVGCFDEAETAILGVISTGGLANDESSGRGAIAHEQAGSKKREVNTCPSQGITKKPRTNRQRARGRGIRGEETQLGKTPRPDPDSWDCIIVGVGESSAELGLSECPSPRGPDATDALNEHHPDSLLDYSINTPSPLQLSHESSDEQAVHTTHENISILNGVDNEGQVSATSRDTLSSQPPSPCDDGGVPKDQQGEGDRISDQRTSNVLGDTILHNALNSTPARQASAIAEQALRMINGPIPLQPLTQGPISVQSDLPGPATLEPQVTTGPPTTMAPSLYRSSPYQAPRHILSRNSAVPEPHSPARSDTQVRARDNVAPTIVRGNLSATPSQMFQSISKILMSNYNRPGTWSLLHVDMLMSRNVTEFYDYFSQLLKAVKGFSALTFGLLDTATESSYPSTYISCGDHSSFQAMKKSIFCHFETCIAKNPALPMFRIVVAPPEKETISLYRFESGGDSPEGLGASRNSLPRAQPLDIRSNPRQAPTGLLKSCHSLQRAFSKPLSNATAPSHNENLITGGCDGHSAAIQARESHSLYPAVVVRIQVNGYGAVSVPYPKAVLAPKVKNAEFFAWFANRTGRGSPTGPTELKFSFKDVVPTPKNNVIARGNEEHFEYMKRDIKPMYELAVANMPGLSEFAILVTVPGWVEETQDETW